MAKELKSIDEVINALEAGERQYRAFKEGVELASELKGLIKSKQELVAFVEKANDDKAALEKSVKASQKKLKDLEVTIADAELKAKDAVQVRVDAILAEANEKAAAILKTADDKKGATVKEIAALELRLADLTSKHDALTADIEKAEKAKAKILSSLAG